MSNIFKITSTTDEFIQKAYDNAMTENNAFYKSGWVFNTPNIIIVPDRETVNRLRGEKTSTWLVGWARDNKVYLLDREKYEQPENDWKRTDAQYGALISHELSHLFFAKESENHKRPNWLNEGTARYVSGQTNLLGSNNQIRNKLKEFNSFLKYYDTHDKGIYFESGFAVETLVKVFGKNTLLDLIKSLKNVNSEEEFNSEFRKNYGFKPSYEKFNELLNSYK